MKGVNLGCGKVIYPPAVKPHHHDLFPDWIYEPGISWDNVDWNPGEGVSHVVDLFDYPWRTQTDCPDCGVKVGQFHKMDCDWESTDTGIFVPDHNQEGETRSLHMGFKIADRDSAYDVAIAAHIVEHIPHHIIEHGKFIHRHPLYQDGWFAWFSELHRILKPGGKAYILVPYAWSHAGISDPTHTRYLTPASFNYLSGDSTEFEYRQAGRWEVHLDRFNFHPHELIGPELPAGPIEELSAFILNLAMKQINAIVDFCIELVALK